MCILREKVAVLLVAFEIMFCSACGGDEQTEKARQVAAQIEDSMYQSGAYR